MKSKPKYMKNTPNQPKGKLYIVATPIGNLKDITLRAIETLKSVDLILAEDTRKTAILINEYEIDTKQKSYREQNRHKVIPEIKTLLLQGKNIALVSDGGTPLISDPGFNLVRELKELGVEIIPIPGPTALTAALSASGLPTDNFTFLGFLPRGKNNRKKILKKYGELDTTIIIYESPFRIKKLLSQIQETLGNRRVCVAAEITKKFESITTKKVSELVKKFKNKKNKGEFTVLIAKKDF
jgi:16S rRNA (cytidine1402-2'-O)-methyltransferase